MAPLGGPDLFVGKAPPDGPLSLDVVALVGMTTGANTPVTLISLSPGAMLAGHAWIRKKVGWL